MTSEADDGSRGQTFPPVFHFVAMCQMAAEGQSEKMASVIEVLMKQRCGIEFLHTEKTAPTDIHQHLQNSYADQTVDVSTVRQWVMHFSSGDSVVKDKPFSGWPCRFLQVQHADLFITG